MVYAGYAHGDLSRSGYGAVSSPAVGLAWSEDLLHWEKDPMNPIFTGSGIEGTPDSHGAAGPFLWLEEGVYFLYYFGVTSSGYEKGTKTLNLALSTDLRSWRRHPGNPIITPSGNGWRRDAIWHPAIVKRHSLYYLFFNASGVDQGREEEFLGYATSPNLTDWRVDDRHSPLLTGSWIPGTWDASGRAGDPSLFRVGDIWYMSYYSWDGTHALDGIAWTSDEEFPLGWRPYHGNPVLRLGPAGSFDCLHAAKPFILHTEARHFHFYTAVDMCESREIALAIWPPLSGQTR